MGGGGSCAYKAEMGYVGQKKINLIRLREEWPGKMQYPEKEGQDLCGEHRGWQMKGTVQPDKGTNLQVIK